MHTFSILNITNDRLPGSKHGKMLIYKTICIMGFTYLSYGTSVEWSNSETLSSSH